MARLEKERKKDDTSNVHEPLHPLRMAYLPAVPRILLKGPHAPVVRKFDQRLQLLCAVVQDNAVIAAEAPGSELPLLGPIGSPGSLGVANTLDFVFKHER